MRYAIVVIAMMGLAACRTGPKYGDPCDAGAPAECTSEKTAAYCEMGAWDEYACAKTCGDDGGCDWSLADVGIHCPDSMEGRGFCATSKRVMRCTGNRFAIEECVRDCVIPAVGPGRPVCN